jgi:hypothetical protein
MSEAKAISPSHARQEPIVGEANPTAANHWLALAGRLDRAGKGASTTMREPGELSLAKWPFLLGDAILLVAAYLIYAQSAPPLGFREVALAVLCVAAGASLSITPYLVEYWAASRRAAAQGLGVAVEQLRVMESAAAQITSAMERWERAQQEASKTAAVANSIVEGKGDAEAQASTESTPRAKASGLATPPIEIEHLRQQESDWIQVLVRMLDHVYALHLGALQSGQPNLIEQVSSFQDACREAARYVGLRPFIAEPDEDFDRHRHQVFEGAGTAPSQAKVAETVATGYTLHGRLLRPALVRLAKSPDVVGAEEQPEQRPAA